jgi:UDP-glucose 4-epimerase
VRDYIHVADLARAHVLALERLQPGFRAYNLGTGEGYSVRQIIDAARKVAGKDLMVQIGPRRPGDPPAQWADPSRAAAELGFRAEASSLESILSSAWSWTTKPPAYAAA